MENLSDKKFQKEINSGTAALVLLATLNHSIEQMYGYQIVKQLEEGRDEIPMIKQGALYPVLRSLENSGLLKSLVEPSITGLPRKYYQITDEGKETLVRWSDIWMQTKLFVDSILEGGKNDK